jgi:proline iminopeptidase
VRVAINGTELWFDVDGAALVHEGAGLRERRAVLVLHGGPGFDHAYLRPHLAPLADVAQVISLDQRGQGRSARSVLETCTIEQMADDAAAFCQTLGIEQPVVLGHSFGGFVALAMALSHPAMVGGLVLVDTAAATSDTADAIAALEARAGAEARDAALRVFSGDTSESALADFACLVAPHYVHDPAQAHLMVDVFARCRLAPDVAGHYFASLAADYDVRADLPRIGASTLVIVGEDDWLCPPAASRAIASGIPHAGLVVIPRAGHLPYGECPASFLAAVRGFLRGLA